MKASELFPELDEGSIKQARLWMLLGLASLIAAGLFSTPLFVGRTPGFQELFPVVDIFKVALVIHVNLSVLFWFMAFSCVMWSLVAGPRFVLVSNAALAMGVLGLIIIIVSPFVGAVEAITNNYIPTLNHPVFFAGLIVFSVGIVLKAIVTLLGTKLTFSNLEFFDALRMSIVLACLVVIISVWALWQSYIGMPEGVTGRAFFEFLYWGFGHVLQFNHSLLMLVAWLILLVASGRKIKLAAPWVLFMAFLSVAPVLATPAIYFSYDVYTPEHRAAFTELMKYGGLTTLPFGLYLAWLFLQQRKAEEEAASLFNVAFVCSATLFLSGGLLGFMIDGLNVVIPAHYHGSIVGVTLSFMGLSYYFLPFFGYAAPRLKLAKRQLYISSVGQMIHIGGFAWSGGYGVQRKTAGADQGLERIEQIIGMGMMGAGAAISVIGGIMFLVVMLLAIKDKPNEKAQ